MAKSLTHCAGWGLNLSPSSQEAAYPVVPQQKLPNMFILNITLFKKKWKYVGLPSSLISLFLCTSIGKKNMPGFSVHILCFEGPSHGPPAPAPAQEMHTRRTGTWSCAGYWGRGGGGFSNTAIPMCPSGSLHCHPRQALMKTETQRKFPCGSAVTSLTCIHENSGLISGLD